MKKVLLLITVVWFNCLNSQTILSGKITDDKGGALPMVIVKVENNPLGAKSNLQGEYKITFPKAGTYTLIASYLGYQEERFIINIAENETQTKNIALQSANKKIKTVTVKGIKNKESEASLLSEQKKAVVIEEKIGAVEMAKKGVSDAESAVAKISGVTKSESGDNGSIFVRGLGDRYNSTTLNGMLLPSESPELKNISLGFFPTNIIQSLGVSKTFNKDILGDFGGAAVNIETKEYSGKPYVDASVGASLNTLAYNNEIKKVGMNWAGGPVNEDFYTNELSTYKFSDVNWNLEKLSIPHIASSVSISGGLSKKFENSAIGIFGTYNYSSNYRYREGLSGTLNANGDFIKKFDKTISSEQTVSRVGMINPYWKSAKGHEVSAVFVNIINSSDEVTSYYGVNSDIDPDVNSLISRGTQNKNNLNIFQVHGKYKLNNKINLHANAAYNQIKSTQPQRVTNILVESRPGEFRLSSNAATNNNLYWYAMDENQMQFKTGVEVDLSKNINSLQKLYIGVNYINKSKDFTSNQYNFKPLSTPIGVYNLDNLNDFYNAANYANGLFEVSFFRANNAPIEYSGTIQNLSGILNYETKLNSKIELMLGFKGEYINQTVHWDVSKFSALISQGLTDIITFKPLPFANMKYAVNDKTNIKGGISKTYTMPQFKEIAPFLYENVVSNSYGNPYLYASDNYNVDVKYEIFPSSSDLLSFGVFGKYIANPINKTLVPNSANEMSYANTGDYAMVGGVEVEIRKSLNKLVHLSAEKSHLTAGLNLSYIYSVQELNDDKILRETNGFISGNFTTKNAALTGASPIIANADISYKVKWKHYEPTFTLVANYASDKLYSLGLYGIGNAYEQGFVTLDFITKHKIKENLSLALGIKNILNPNINRYQEVAGKESVVYNQYQNGIGASLSLNYHFQ